ncbi:MAG: hypothetical protein R2865_01880 [Deinococcales bacterium]
MFSNITLILALVGSASGILGYLRRHRNLAINILIFDVLYVHLLGYLAPCLHL